MDELKDRTARVSIQLLVVSAVIGFLIYAMGVGFAFYLVPINIVVSVYIVLKEVQLMIDSGGAEDIAV